MRSRLRALLDGYLWLWRAQSRWHTGPRWLVPVMFAGQVLVDASQFVRSWMGTRATRATVAGLVVLGIVASSRDGVLRHPTEQQRLVEPPPVLVNGARLRVGDVAPPEWRMASAGATAEEFVEVRTALDSLYSDRTQDGATAFLMRWDLEPWSTMSIRSGTTIMTIGLLQPLPQPTQWPTVHNVAEVQRAIVSAYPMHLREEGRGGTAAIQFLIGADGSILRTRLRQTSGYPELDEAALSVARVYRFAPAIHNGLPVQSWATTPISFRVSNQRS